MTHTLYEIRIAGLLPDDVVGQLGKVRVKTAGVTTVLTGELDDQAALLGVLAQLRALDLELVEVRRVPVTPEDLDPPPEPPDSASRP